MKKKSCFLFLGAVIVVISSSFAAESPFKSAKLGFEIKNSKNLSKRNLLSDKWRLFGNTTVLENNIIVCDNKEKNNKFTGAYQSVKLNQKQAAKISFSAESKCENPEKRSGGYEYSVYVDVYYTDGSCTYGVIAPFRNGSADWEKIEKVFVPQKPIRTVGYKLIYNFPGKAWFRNAVLTTDSEKGKIFINGKKIGEVPVNESEKYRKVSLEIPQKQLAALATVNIVNTENTPVKYGDLFTVKNVFLEVTDAKGSIIKSNVAEGPFTSFKTGFVKLENGKKQSTYHGAPLPDIKLTLATDTLGYIKPPVFERKTGELYRDDTPRKWPGLEKAALNGTKRTACSIRSHEFISWPKEYTLAMLERNNSDRLTIDPSALEKQNLEKIQFLKRHGIKIDLIYGVHNAYKRLPESDGYKTFFKKLAKLAPLADAVGMDECFLSPAMLKTEGGHVTPITEKFIGAFAKWSGYSYADALWGFKHHRAADPRALKAWEFCVKVQNNFSREFVRVAKRANPAIKTWVSYPARNWNKLVCCNNGAIEAFDEILQCQTYWYGRAAEDSLNSSLVTAPIGMGKIFKTEYPDKFLWMGIDPGYTGGKSSKVNKNSWGNKLYGNSVEETVPYLALLYAVSDGVYVQSAGGGIWLLKDNSVIDGAYVDKFADAVNLVSRLVPFIKSYRKSNIAYYYEPDAEWEIIRKVNRYPGTSRQTTEISVGLIQQFCNVDVTKNIGKYKNVIYAGLLLPSKFEYARQNIYLMYSPEYDEKGNKIPETQLFEKLNLKGFCSMGKNFFPADNEENGCKDMFKIPNMKVMRLTGKTIKGAAYLVRTASGGDKPYFICARNKAGNVLVNSLWPSYTLQNVAEKIIKEDLDYFKWVKRDCPQVDGTDRIVAVAFRKARTAVLDFGSDATFSEVKLVMFNGKDGVVRNETVNYAKGMKVELPPLNVLVASGVK